MSFRFGLQFGVLCWLITMNCWIDPFPLVSTRDGYSNKLLDWALYSAFTMGLLTLILAFFGRGWPRALLFASNLLLFAMLFGAPSERSLKK
jgi:hypothetical protein